jgi:hypothetical protein
MFFYRESPIPVPPSQGSLKFWLDAQDLTVADGTEILVMNNKGTLGGTFIERPSADTRVTAATVDGKRALYQPPGQYSFSGLVSTQNLTTASSHTFVAVVRNQQTYVPPVDAITSEFTVFRVGNLGLGGYEGNPSGYFVSWTINTYPPGGGNPSSTQYKQNSIDVGTTKALVLQNNTSIPSETKFNKILKNNTDFETLYSPVTLAPNTLFIGTDGQGSAGGRRQTFAGNIFEILVWEGIVSDSSIRSYLNQKYGGTW